jgi:hypothetical protein
MFYTCFEHFNGHHQEGNFYMLFFICCSTRTCYTAYMIGTCIRVFKTTL